MSVFVNINGKQRPSLNATHFYASFDLNSQLPYTILLISSRTTHTRARKRIREKNWINFPIWLHVNIVLRRRHNRVLTDNTNTNNKKWNIILFGSRNWYSNRVWVYMCSTRVYIWSRRKNENQFINAFMLRTPNGGRRWMQETNWAYKEEEEATRKKTLQTICLNNFLFAGTAASSLPLAATTVCCSYERSGEFSGHWE